MGTSPRSSPGCPQKFASSEVRRPRTKTGGTSSSGTKSGFAGSTTTTVSRPSRPVMTRRKGPRSLSSSGSVRAGGWKSRRSSTTNDFGSSIRPVTRASSSALPRSSPPACRSRPDAARSGASSRRGIETSTSNQASRGAERRDSPCTATQARGRPRDACDVDEPGVTEESRRHGPIRVERLAQRRGAGRVVLGRLQQAARLSRRGWPRWSRLPPPRARRRRRPKRPRGRRPTRRPDEATRGASGRDGRHGDGGSRRRGVRARRVQARSGSSARGGREPPTRSSRSGRRRARPLVEARPKARPARRDGVARAPPARRGPPGPRRDRAARWPHAPSAGGRRRLRGREAGLRPARERAKSLSPRPPPRGVPAAFPRAPLRRGPRRPEGPPRPRGPRGRAGTRGVIGTSVPRTLPGSSLDAASLDPYGGRAR